MSLEELIKKDPGFTPTRLNSLYLDFSSLKLLNPEGYEANISAWRALLLGLLQNGSFASSLAIPTTSPNLIQKLSISKFGKPKALSEVLTILVQQHDLIPLSEYLLETQSYHVIFQDPYISAYFNPNKWLNWGKRYLRGNFKVSNNKGELIADEYIFWDHLTEIATEIITAIYIEPRSTYSDSLLDIGQFNRLVQSKTNFKLSENDFKILLKYYTRDKPYLKLAKSHSGEEIIMLKESLTASNNLEVLELDFGIVALKRSIFQTESRKEQLEKKIDQLLQQLKEIAQKVPHTAASNERLKLILRLKQILAKSYRTSIGAHKKLVEALNLINDATSNGIILSQLENSSLLLEKLNMKVDQNKLDEVISNFEDNISETQKISDMIGAMQGEDEDVDEEYEKLLLEVKKQGPIEQKIGMQQQELQENQMQPESDNYELLGKLEKLSLKDTNERKDHKEEQNEEQKEEQKIPLTG